VGSESIVYIDFFDSNSKSSTESEHSELTEYQEMPTSRPLDVRLSAQGSKTKGGFAKKILKARNPLDIAP
jgi:hypothetical protein